MGNLETPDIVIHDALKLEPGATYTVHVGGDPSLADAERIRRAFEYHDAQVIVLTGDAKVVRQDTAHRSVLQPWVEELTMMQQSVLLTGVRGPDGLPKYHPTKYLLRWYRRCILRSSFLGTILTDPIASDGGSFLGASLGLSYDNLHEVPRAERVFEMTSDWRPAMHERVTDYLAALDEIPHHFQLHLMHAAEILAYKHPDTEIALWWQQVYERLVHDMHLWPETEKQLDARLGDSRDGWLARADKATVK